jgi:dTDP-4-dehydrorhamnose 3,5-epimerase
MLEEIKIFQTDSFEDHRGELYTVFNQKDHDIVFNHDKISVSKKNVLRGLHGDYKSHKLLSCIKGSLYVVVVDARENSKTYKEWDSFILTDMNKVSILVPPGFANGHYVLSEEAILYYKWSYPGEYPDVQDQFTVKWNNPSLKIQWPTNNPILSERDK